MISTKGRYALLIMIDLAVNGNGEYVSLKDISARQGVSVKYLEQITPLLHKAGFLRSARGLGGGYMLSRDPSEYTAGDILRAAEGSLAPVKCLKDEENTCEKKDSCPTLKFWEDYYKATDDYLDGVTLKQLAGL